MTEPNPGNQPKEPANWEGVTASPPLLSAETLDGLRELASADDPDFLARLLKTFIAYNTEQVKRLGLALETEDRKSILQISHAMKSSAFGIGAEKYGSLCASTEREGHSLPLPKLTVRIGELVKAFGETERELCNLPELKS